jgi:hypothetical protein
LAITVAARTFCEALKVALKQHYGSQSPILAAFGIPTDKAFVATLEQKALANARRAQTRLARGTTGPKAKLAVVTAGCPLVTVPPNGSLRICAPRPEAPPRPHTLSEAVLLVRGSPASSTSEEEE